MIKKGDACYEAFIKRGWTWGGDWKSLKDYQHFEK
ncbi:MAG: M15 family metallopeptidase [Paeniclostridium sordellii]|nr:M15 family metallopeptidase [Paeniclostridium sordellii]